MYDAVYAYVRACGHTFIAVHAPAYIYIYCVYNLSNVRLPHPLSSLFCTLYPHKLHTAGCTLLTQFLSLENEVPFGSGIGAEPVFFPIESVSKY